ncbi:MAG TPA: WD40 repeat domain-containing protein [Gemmataceae bacterium]|nr:WD40 repeat domain-containing protein [Gemmataceae bacterium]
MKRFIFTACLAVLIIPSSPAYGAKVKVWHHCLPAHYEKAQIQGAIVTSEGTLRLSRQLKPLVNIDAAHIWDIVEDKTGNLFVATGDDGRVYKVTPDGKTSVVYSGNESQIFCLAQAPDGSIYAGTGPNGQIVRLMPDGKTEVLYQSPEAYIWSLVLDTAGQTIYAGTGPKGRIYQVTTQGKGSVFYTTKQDHILALAMGPENTLYAGTDKNGLVYRFDTKGKGFVLFNAPQSEIRSLVVGTDGIYAGTSVPRRRSNYGTRADSGESNPGRLNNLLEGTSKAPAKTSEEISGGTTSSSSAGKDKEEKSNPAPAPVPPSSGDNSLYHITADGSVREVFREKAMILSVLRQNGKFFIGTGMDGRLFEVDEATKVRSEVARLDHGQVQSICRRHDGSIVLGTGDPGKLYVLQDKFNAKGTIVSEVLDAKLISKWGALHWKSQTPPQTKVTVAVRSGNLAEPDETWSDWSKEEADAEKAIAATPNARYLQYRITLTTEDAAVSPSLKSISLRYSTRNQAPEVTAIDIPDLDAVNLENPKKIKFKWTAVDPNEDELTYNLFVRKDNWKNWILLEENWDKKDYEWDTTTTPSGMYQLKVVASDRKDNPEEEALTGTRISPAFPVAHTPPTVAITFAGMEGDQAVMEATATDSLVRLTAASFAVNGKKWENVFPSDGLFDSKTETFRFKTAPLKPGTYVVVLRVRDAAGNLGSGDVVFSVAVPSSQK